MQVSGEPSPALSGRMGLLAFWLTASNRGQQALQTNGQSRKVDGG